MKTVISPYELDIYIPEINLALEFNGNYWHSLEFSEEHQEDCKNRHLNKVIMCNKQNIRLIHIWENEWNSDKEKIKEKLKLILEKKEFFEFFGNRLTLDRSWFNNIEIPGYILTESTDPEIILRDGFHVEDCGKLIFSRTAEIL